MKVDKNALKKVLIVDDEAHLLDWLEEYIASRGYKVEFVENLNRAVEALDASQFASAIFDLNIPVIGDLASKIDAKRGGTHAFFPGLYAAEFAKTKGMQPSRITVYSVHDNPEVRERCDVLHITYLVKGRPREFKQHIDNLLSAPPK